MRGGGRGAAVEEAARRRALAAKAVTGLRPFVMGGPRQTTAPPDSFIFFCPASSLAILSFRRSPPWAPPSSPHWTACFVVACGAPFRCIGIHTEHRPRCICTVGLVHKKGLGRAQRACIQACLTLIRPQPTPPLITHREPKDRALVASDVAARLLALHGIRNVEVPVQVDPLDPKGAAGDLRVVEVRSHRGGEEAAADCHLHRPLVVASLDRLDGLPHLWARYGGHLYTPTRLQPAAGLGCILLEDVRDRVRGLLVVCADGAAVRVLERAVNDL
eukprot:scaffold13221_cov63-Phaeocystis_antarctica.AAC.2